MPEYKLGRLKGNWVVTWREGDKRPRHRLFASSERQEVRTKKEAERRFKEFSHRCQVQEEPVFSELWNAYCEEKKGKRVVEIMGYEWKAIAPHFAHLRTEDFSTEVCRSYTAERRRKGKKDGTIWTELGHIRTVLKWAHEHRLIDFAPPIERPRKPAPKDRFLTTSECQRLIEAATTPHIKLSIILMLSTACRVGALLELEWDRVDFSKGVIDLKVDSATTRKGRATVPMNAGAKAALFEAKKGALSEFVIEWNGQQVKSIKTGFNKAVQDAGLENVSPHVLRHSAAVHLAAAGVPMQKIAQYLGHSNTAVTEHVYARYAPDHLREESSILDFTRIKQVQ
nr:site-specific integrase [uncultured Cohaesibacter sp.]